MTTTAHHPLVESFRRELRAAVTPLPGTLIALIHLARQLSKTP